MAVNVLIVDDSGFFRKRLKEILESSGKIKIVGMATNGREAVDLAKKLKPDVITMDYEMPVMDGISAIKLIMADSPCPILMFSSLTHEGARVTLDALDAGAVDYLPKNFEDIARDATKMQEVLIARILSIAGKRTLRPATPSTPSAQPRATTARPAERPASRLTPARAGAAPAARPTATASRASKHKVDIVAIGTSTGGPVALQTIISKLPATFPVPILLIQHMPASFTPAFAERLNSLSQIKVKQAEEGDVLTRGCAYLAPGGKQMLVGSRGGRSTLSIIDGDERLTYKPSVDLTFGSVAKTFPGKVLSIVLTGMGADGREGCRLMKSGGSTVWTQSEATCVVYGMPMAVDRAGYSDQSLDIGVIAEHLINRLA